MEKDFDSWNVKKKKADDIKIRPMFKERDVWWCSIGTNIGDEQDGKGENFTRPVLVVRKFNHNIFIGIPLSTKIKDSTFYHKIHFMGRDQSLMLSQIRIMDAKRLRDKMGSMPSNEMENIKEKLRKLVLY